MLHILAIAAVRTLIGAKKDKKDKKEGDCKTCSFLRKHGYEVCTQCGCEIQISKEELK